MPLIGLQCVIVVFLSRTRSLLYAQVSDPDFVLSCVPQGAVLGPFLAFCSINDLSDNFRSSVCPIIFHMFVEEKARADVVCFLYSILNKSSMSMS